MDINFLMKQAKQMQNQISKIEAEINEMEYEGTAGGANVKATIKGNMELTSLSIDEELLEKDNREMLEELVLVAVNSAIKAATEDKNEKMGALTQGVKFPGLF